MPGTPAHLLLSHSLTVLSPQPRGPRPEMPSNPRPMAQTPRLLMIPPRPNSNAQLMMYDAARPGKPRSSFLLPLALLLLPSPTSSPRSPRSSSASCASCPATEQRKPPFAKQALSLIPLDAAMEPGPPDPRCRPIQRQRPWPTNTTSNSSRPQALVHRINHHRHRRTPSPWSTRPSPASASTTASTRKSLTAAQRARPTATQSASASSATTPSSAAPSASGATCSCP